MNPKPTILLVDDSETVTDVLAHYLDEFFAVLIASSGEEALTLADAHLPDLILTDVMMPGMDGFETCRRLKANPRTRDIPVLFESGSTMKLEDKLKAFQVGGVDYIDKSCDIEEIYARITAHLTIRRQQQELERQRQELERKNEQLRRLQQQLVTQEKLASLGELTAGIAHEIKNPINIATSFVQIQQERAEDLRKELAKPESERDQDEIEYILENFPMWCQESIENNLRAVRIVQGMLEHSRGEGGKRKPVPLNQLVEEYLKLAYHGMRAKAKDFNVTLDTQFDPAFDTKEIQVFPQELARAFTNLCMNAFHAMQDKQELQGDGYKPVLQVQTHDSDYVARITIRDNGIGIPDKVKAKIFQPFFTTKPAGDGTGLGLSLTHDWIVNVHGGQLLVNTQPGEYTEFEVVLPTLEQEEA